MPISVTCPKCGGVLNAPDDAGGKRGRCPTCATVLSIPLPGGPGDPPLGGGLRPAGGPNPFTAAPADTGAHGTITYSPPPPAAPLPNPASAQMKKLPAPETPGRGTTFGFADDKATARPAGTFGKGGGNVPSRADLQLPNLPNPASGQRGRAQLPPIPHPASLPQGPAVPDDVRRWRKVASGLGWLRFAAWMVLLAFLSTFGLKGAELYGKLVPVPAELAQKLQQISPDPQIALRVAAFGLFLVLALLGHLFGRVGVGAAPHGSGGRGAARLSLWGTLLAFAGLATGVAVGAERVKNGGTFFPAPPGTDPKTLAQLFGLTLAAAFFVVSELWLVLAVGQMGAGLRDATASRRAGRFAGLVGLGVVLAAAGTVAWTHFPGELTSWWEANVAPQLEKAGEHRKAVPVAAAALGVLFAAVLYLRFLGGLKRAARGYGEGMKG